MTRLGARTAQGQDRYGNSLTFHFENFVENKCLG
jgi:hypothetical protein